MSFSIECSLLKMKRIAFIILLLEYLKECTVKKLKVVSNALYLNYLFRQKRMYSNPITKDRHYSCEIMIFWFVIAYSCFKQRKEFGVCRVWIGSWKCSS